MDGETEIQGSLMIGAISLSSWERKDLNSGWHDAWRCIHYFFFFLINDLF